MANKLELTWVGKENEIKVEPRLLIERPELSNMGKVHEFSEENSSRQRTTNMLIHGDNLLALKALEADFAGTVKCIYIDPPYNTGSAFEHYDDNLEHSQWLSLMKPRLEILRKLLSDDGFFCCQIDDSEGAYLKVLLDEVFGRNNYLTTIYVRVRYPDKTLKQDMDFHKEIEQIHIYRKSYAAEPNLDEVKTGYEKFNYKINLTGNPQNIITLGGKKVEIYAKDSYKITKYEGDEYGLKEIWASGTILDGNSSGRFFRDYLTGRYEQDGYGVLYKVNGIGDDRYDYRFFTGPNKAGATKGKYYQGVPKDKLEAGEVTQKLSINGFYDMAGNFGNCRQEGNAPFRGGKKPEVLIQLLLKHFSNEGDLILDSFLGSGSTIAAAHKMKRRWLGIELGEHAYSLCKPRLDKVIAGEDAGGITKATGWQGGGGYRFYELAPSLVLQDDLGESVINPAYDAARLAAAVALHEGFTYAPDSGVFWKQAHSSEKSYLFVTTRHITAPYLDSIHDAMQDGEYLVIACKSFDRAVQHKHKNIIVKKIPQMLLAKCEFGKDSYALNIVRPPVYEDEEDCDA